MSVSFKNLILYFIMVLISQAILALYMFVQYNIIVFAVIAWFTVFQIKFYAFYFKTANRYFGGEKKYLYLFHLLLSFGFYMFSFENSEFIILSLLNAICFVAFAIYHKWI
jgi:hypothetical protein